LAPEEVTCHLLWGDSQWSKKIRKGGREIGPTSETWNLCRVSSILEGTEEASGRQEFWEVSLGR
jgi:hypothetical protein